MPLIKCPDCGNQYSDSAKSCNKCGFTDKVKRSVFIYKIIFYIITLLTFLSISISSFNYTNLTTLSKDINNFGKNFSKNNNIPKKTNIELFSYQKEQILNQIIIDFLVWIIISIFLWIKIYKGNIKIRNRQ